MASNSSAVALLAKTRLFTGVDAAALRGLAERSTFRRYRRGEVIVHQGDPGDRLFVIASGRVKVVVGSAEGDEMVLVTLGTPETFGELALVDGGQRSASVEAIEATELLLLMRTDFFDVVHEHPVLVDGLLRSLGGVVRRLTDQAADLVFLDLHGRLAKLLLTLAADAGQQPGQDPVIELGLTQTDIAHMVGGSRQSVNQILHSFEAAGYIQMSGHSVRILRAEALRRRAGSV